MPKENRVTATKQRTKQLIRVGHSPDPDDAFMFYALAKDKIETGEYEFTHELVDIETLNRRAFQAELELTALSIHAYAYLHDKYVLCTCGASMGDGYGPMVVTREPQSVDALESQTIAVPGRLTSAYLALRLCLGADFASVEVPFDEIIPAVVAGEYRGQKIDAGLIIHEGQLTYGDQDLKLVVDLGAWWKDRDRPAAAAGRKRRPQVARSRSDPRDSAAALREHRIWPRTPRTRPELCFTVWPRSRRRAGRHVRRHVRQRLDARLRRPRPRGGGGVPRPRPRGRRAAGTGDSGICGMNHDAKQHDRNWQAQLDAAIDRSVDGMVALRRHLHMHPEPSGEELQTSLHLYQLFANAGLRCGWGPKVVAWWSIAAIRRPSSGSPCGPIAMRCGFRTRSRSTITAACRK